MDLQFACLNAIAEYARAKSKGTKMASNIVVFATSPLKQTRRRKRRSWRPELGDSGVCGLGAARAGLNRCCPKGRYLNINCDSFLEEFHAIANDMALVIQEKC